MRLGRDRFGEFVEHCLNRRGRDHRQSERHRFLPRWTDRAEEIQRFMAEIARPPRPHTFLIPATAGAAGLTDAGFILEPDLDPLGLRVSAGDLSDQALEVFFTACAAGSALR